MKKRLVVSCLSVFCVAILHAQSFSIVVDNPSKTDKKDAPVVLKLKDYTSNRVRSAVVTCNGKEIPSQLDDLNHDGVNDELCFLVDLKKKDLQTYNITLSDQGRQKRYPSRVYVDMMISNKKIKESNKQNLYISQLTVENGTNVYSMLHHHGAAFESELVAYRIYFDHRQTVDIYGKYRKGLELKETQFYPDNTQKANGYGDDVLWVGETLGLGSFRGWNGDSPTMLTDVDHRSQRIIANGPLRTIVEVVDEGWAVNKKADLFQVVPEIDLKEIVDYAKSKNVGIILWAGCYAFDRDMEHVCKYYSEMGVKGFKIDFMNRDDELMVQFHYRAAAMAAKYHLLVDFHGTYKPTGLNRTYPNVINFEGVDGQEQNKWATTKDYDQVQYDVTVPYARMLVGQMDYTQGAMLNGTRDAYHPSNSCPMSQGTRAHQLAMYTVFFSPLNMLCDSPTNYEKEPECTEFISGVPTTWDATCPLDGKVGEYAAVARRKGSTWYVGVLTNWTARDIILDLSAIKAGGKKAVSFGDGVNADKNAQDYVKKEITIPVDGKLKVHLAPGGGFTLKNFHNYCSNNHRQ